MGGAICLDSAGGGKIALTVSEAAAGAAESCRDAQNVSKSYQ